MPWQCCSSGQEQDSSACCTFYAAQSKKGEGGNSLSCPARISFSPLNLSVWMAMLCCGIPVSRARPDTQQSPCNLWGDLRTTLLPGRDKPLDSQAWLRKAPGIAESPVQRGQRVQELLADHSSTQEEGSRTFPLFFRGFYCGCLMAAKLTRGCSFSALPGGQNRVLGLVWLLEMLPLLIIACRFPAKPWF